MREQRGRAGLSLGQVAEYDNLSKQYLSNLELGRNEPPTWPLLAKLAARYGVSADYLLGLTDDPVATLGGPLADDALPLLERMAQLSTASQALALELLGAVVRWEEARRVQQFGDWGALHSLLSKLADVTSVEAVSNRLSDREIVTLSEILRLAQAVKQDEGDNGP